MIRHAMFTCLIFLVISYSIEDNLGLCEEECPLLVSNLSPTGEIKPEVQPTISATLKSSCSADIDLSSIEMLLNGTPVAYTLIGSGSEVTVNYAPDNLIEDSTHKIIVRAKDVKGRTAEKTWEFYRLFWY
jgi:hypothetical protein